MLLWNTPDATMTGTTEKQAMLKKDISMIGHDLYKTLQILFIQHGLMLPEMFFWVIGKGCLT